MSPQQTDIAVGHYRGFPVHAKGTGQNFGCLRKPQGTPRKAFPAEMHDAMRRRSRFRYRQLFGSFCGHTTSNTSVGIRRLEIATATSRLRIPLTALSLATISAGLVVSRMSPNGRTTTNSRRVLGAGWTENTSRLCSTSSQNSPDRRSDSVSETCLHNRSVLASLLRYFRRKYSRGSTASSSLSCPHSARSSSRLRLLIGIRIP